MDFNEQQDAASAYPLEDSLGYLLFRLSKGLQLEFEARISQFDLTAPQWGLLNACYQKQAQTPSEFAKLMAIDNAAVTRHVKTLTRKGLVRFEPHESDRRSYRVYLTSTAEKIVEAIIPISQQMNREMVSSLSQEQKEQFLYTVLQLLQSNRLLD